jgi:regulator of nucleoside diphosphate kinase
MKRIILNKLDYMRIRKHLREAQMRKAIDAVNAGKLAQELESGVLMEPQDIPSDVVTMNSVVKISFVGEEQQQEFRIVYPDEADFRMKKVSIFAPIATALIGFRVGDLIEWMVPGGLKKIKIDGISYQPEAAGEYSL